MAQRPIVTTRSLLGQCFAMPSRTNCSPQFSSIGLRNWPSGGSGRPSLSPPTALPAPQEQERLVGFGDVRILVVVDEELARPFVAGVALALDRLVGHALFAVVETAENQLPRRHVLDVISRRHHAAGFEHQGFEARFAQLFRRPAPRHARADDDRVIGLRHGAPYSDAALSAGAQGTYRSGMIS